MHNPFFFLHIPRTAGTTLNAVLRSHFSPDKILSVYDKEDYEKYRYVDNEVLKPIQLITGHLLLDETDPPQIYGLPVRVITLLREPVGRLVSEYDFLRTWRSNHLYALLNDNNISFKEYLTSTERILYYRGKNFMTRCISGMNFEGSYPRRALARAKKNLDRNFFFVGIQERFDESLVMLGQMLGLSNLLHDRRNALNRDSIPCPDESDLAFARDMNKADIELYAFACELFAERVQALGPEFESRVREFSFLNGKYRKMAQLLRQSAGADEQGDIKLAKDGDW